MLPWSSSWGCGLPPHRPHPALGEKGCLLELQCYPFLGLSFPEMEAEALWFSSKSVRLGGKTPESHL